MGAQALPARRREINRGVRVGQRRLISTPLFCGFAGGGAISAHTSLIGVAFLPLLAREVGGFKEKSLIWMFPPMQTYLDGIDDMLKYM
jgi:hypothetical protein